jgi:hypothetical protein
MPSFGLWALVVLLLCADEGVLSMRIRAHRKNWDVKSALSTHKKHKSEALANEATSALTSGGTAKAKVAIAITVTKDPDFTKKSSDPNMNPGGFVDGAAILAHSVKLSMTAKYPVDMIALVLPKVKILRPILQKFGYRVIEYEFPMTSKDIKGKELAGIIDKSGCCGMAELAKLGAFKLTEYEKVLVMDSDTMLLQNIDELWASSVDALYTYDWGLSPSGKCINGGFAMIKPSMATYQGLVDTVQEGDWRGGGAWGGTGIGYCYGGQTYQGLIPFFYQSAKAGKALTYEEVDSCLYNNMAASTNTKKRKQDTVPVKEIKTFHFTVCQKPWSCNPHGGIPVCKELHTKWWALRASFEKELGLEQGPRCKGDYQKMALE